MNSRNPEISAQSSAPLSVQRIEVLYFLIAWLPQILSWRYLPDIEKKLTSFALISEIRGEEQRRHQKHDPAR
jgi:hypothetical protein